jgi:integration host factor subunit beta
MFKSRLIARIHEQKAHLYRRHVEKAVEIVFEEIAAALQRDDRVELRGFGVFSVRKRPARLARSPRTGAAVAIKQKRFLFFKSGRGLHDREQQERTRPPIEAEAD